MKKSMLFTIVFFTAIRLALAGDAAVFVDKGFSSDGSTYVFAQYGKTDIDFYAWAEIFTVDVATNKFKTDQVFKTPATIVTKGSSGFDTYQALEKKAQSALNAYALSPCCAKQVLYVMEAEDKVATDKITFTDFENSKVKDPITYEVELQPTFIGTGANCKSSFVIKLEKKAANGSLIYSKTVGTPSVKRSGITGYRIARIMQDSSKHSLVFVIEKTLEDSTGVSIRYMVESTTE